MTAPDPLVAVIAKAIYTLNPARQPWDGDAYAFHEAGAGFNRVLAERQAVAVAAAVREAGLAAPEGLREERRGSRYGHEYRLVTPWAVAAEGERGLDSRSTIP